MQDLTAFQRDMLYVIAGLTDDPKGLAIKDGLEAYYEEEINHGHLYPNLNRLVDIGLVEKGAIDDRTNAYTLTTQGEKAITARREWETQHLDDPDTDGTAPRADD